MEQNTRTYGWKHAARVAGASGVLCAVFATSASAQIAGDANSASRIDQAATATTGATDLLLGGTRIFSADIPDGSQQPVQSGAEAFNIPSEVLYSWSGPYVGIRAGTVVANGNAALSGTLEVGYDFQPNDRIVTGVEADIAWRGDTSTLTDTPALGTITGRLGFLPTERILIYGEAGGALGSVRGANAAGVTDTELTPGYTLGAGAEFALDDTLTFVGEYTYTDLGDRTVPTGTDSLTSNSFEAGIKLRF